MAQEKDVDGNAVIVCSFFVASLLSLAVGTLMFGWLLPRHGLADAAFLVAVILLAIGAVLFFAALRLGLNGRACTAVCAVVLTCLLGAILISFLTESPPAGWSPRSSDQRQSRAGYTNPLSFFGFLNGLIRLVNI